MILLLGSCARTLAEGSRHHSDSAGITTLVALARNGTDEQKARAAHALWTLAFDNADNAARRQFEGQIINQQLIAKTLGQVFRFQHNTTKARP